MDTRFQNGNQFWKLRTKHGRDKLFTTPEILWDACCEYFQATDNRKWIKVEYVGKDAERVEVPITTPYTLTGLHIFLDIDEKTWSNYKQRTDYIGVITHVEKIIYTQKFEGATVGIFKENIISRDLGLTDKREVTERKPFVVEIDPNA